jgi:4-amino-4-deoxy-L-arabinose transferase-like glycosyltransferase
MLVVLGAVAAVTLYVRWRLATVPLERDEGEYAYAGQLILAGLPPYGAVYNMKFPGAYYAYAAVMALLGQTDWAIRMGLLITHLATAGLVFAVARRWAGPLAAVISAATFMLLGLDRWAMGMFAHATHFIALAAVASIYCLERGRESSRRGWFLAAGVAAGLAVVMKQHAAAFPLLAAALAMWGGPGGHLIAPWRRAALVSAGVVVPLAATVAVLAAAGVLDRFWFWTFQYAASYVSINSPAAAWPIFTFAWGFITQANWWLWYSGVAGLVLLFVTRWPGHVRLTLGGFALAAALSVIPGFYFRPHYFIVLMPAAAWLAGIAAATLARGVARHASASAARRLVVLAFAGGVAAPYVAAESRYLFQLTPDEVSRVVYDYNPFPESRAIAAYLARHTSPSDRVVVFGSEPQIYFYSQRRSATGYIYTYPLMERQPFASTMQREMMREVEAARPTYMVFVAIAASWGGQPGSDRSLLQWANEYTARCFDRVGVADIRPDGTRFVWDDAARDYPIQSKFLVMTFRRTRC